MARQLVEWPVLLLVVACVVVYFAAVVDRDLFVLLGLAPASWVERPWNLATSLFVHANIWHLTANMLALHYLGGLLSKAQGSWRFLGLYFAGGIAGGLLYVLLGDPQSIAIGASGAIFAVGGALAITTPKTRAYVFPIPRAIPMWAAIFGTFIVVSFIPHVAWQAHLGGRVVGLGAGYFPRKRPQSATES